MKIPSNYDTNKDYNQTREQITPGGHKCIIKYAEEGKSRSGKQMLTIQIETSFEDAQPGFFQKRFDADTRADKKWPGNMYIVFEYEKTKDGHDKLKDWSEANFNKFLSALDHSNANFKLAPGAELDPRQLMNLKVGVIFREEEYEPQTATMTDLMNGVYPKTVRPAFWCGYDTAFDEKVPKPKTINKVETAAATPTPGASYGFVNVPADALEDEGLPFK